MARRYKIGQAVSQYTRQAEREGLEWLRVIRGLTANGQMAAAQEAIAYANAYVAAFDGAPANLDNAVRGVDKGYGNNPLGRTFQRIQIKANRVTERDGVEAGRRWLESKASRTAADLTWLAARDTLQAAVEQHPALVGYRRIASPLACGACLALATGRVMPPAEAFRDHPHCRCTMEPVVKGAPLIQRMTGKSYFEAMTDAEQNNVFGPVKADLLRSGDITLDDLVSKPKGHIGRRKLITETPLNELTSTSA